MNPPAWRLSGGQFALAEIQVGSSRNNLIRGVAHKGPMYVTVVCWHILIFRVQLAKNCVSGLVKDMCHHDYP